MIPVADRPAAQARVERFVRERPHALLYDPSASLLLDVPSGRSIALDWSTVRAVGERLDTDTVRPWLALERDDGLVLGLADQGIVFAPSVAATGPLEGLPAAVCLGDLAAAEGRLLHFLRDHPDDEPSRTHVSLFLFCLAVVDGARGIGFDVGREERRLDAMLEELEKRKRG